jgi:amidase
MTGHPSIVMPVGKDPQGLPIGVQVVARRWQDAALLDSADQLAAHTEGYQRPPDY